MISVVMASFLGEYQGAAQARDRKFLRAVNSYLDQGVGELIIVADGCDKTVELAANYKYNPEVRCIKIDKQPHFSGQVRQHGINAAKYDWICYLDSDDEFGEGHLEALAKGIDDKHDWFYFDDYVSDQRRNCIVSFCRIGTSAILHKKNTTAKWPDGYNHDWGFIQQLGPNHKKIDGAHYIVHHIPGKLDE